MNRSKQLNSAYKVMLSPFASKSEIEKVYSKCDETEAKVLYLKVLTEVKENISLGNIKDLRTLDKAIAVVNETENKVTLKSYFESDENPIRDTNAIILACKHNEVKVLEYIFSSECKILDNLSTHIEIPAILPNDKDEDCHNPFYYAIRSNNVQLLEELIETWPNDYFNLHSNELDEILSKAYKELKLKHIPLSDKMQFFVENRLINIRFFSETSKNIKHTKPSFDNITERIRFVLENISMLSKEYSSSKEVNEKFLVAAKFIAQNIHILKRLLKSTYDRIPWEEMEFCLIVFVKFKLLKGQHSNNNQMCSYILTKKRILMHLENFAVQLNASEISKSYANKRLPCLRREVVVANIIHSFPAFEQLYNDHEKVTDIYSLDKISSYIELALMVDPKEEDDHLMIIRALQVIGEFLKNTLESPKLSCTASELLLLSAPKNTSDILADLRNSLSHAHAVSKRLQIEESGDVVFFTKVQNDLRKIGSVVADVLFRFKIKMCRTILKDISSSTSLKEMREIAEEFHFVEIGEPALQNLKTSEHEKIMELIQKLSAAVNEKTDYETTLFSKISDILTAENKGLTGNEINYVVGISMLKNINMLINNNKTDTNTMKVIKSFTNLALENIRPKMKPQSLKKVAELVIEIASLAKPRLQLDNIDEVNKLMLQIFYVSQFEIDNIEWIGKLREKLTKSKFSKVCASVELKQTRTKLAIDEQGSSPLKIKLSTLKSILNDNALDSQLIENYPLYKDNRKLQAAVEMLVQDIMSILGCSDYLTNNHFFLDDNAPLLIGKSLRNHLAHGNALIDILFDPSIAIVSNASKLISENVSNNKKYIGKLVQDNPSGSKEKFERDLQIVVTQETMFTAIEEGNFKDLKICIKNGADINARNINLQTALHFAAKGPNLEILKFVSAEIITSNDVDGKSPLHVAAASGNVSNVEFFFKGGVNINENDNDKQTPLHIAAQKGYRNVVELLLKNGAKTNNKDVFGFSPVHYGIANNYKDIAVILLEKETGIDVNESMGGYTPLHIAAEKGVFEIALFLLRNKANVNAQNDRNWTPLHAAAVNGHFEIAQVLVLNGADVNSKVLTDGCTPLHYAVENGNESIVKLLLQNGANVNGPNKIFYHVPLHYAAKGGYVQIVELFLKNKVDVHAVSFNGMTPLHVAAESGHKEIVDLLIKNGANVEAKSNGGFTALHVSAYCGFKDVAELLIEKGAMVHVKGKDGQTPLHFAGMSGNRDIVELLIAEQADVDAVDVFGFTTFHLSAISGHLDVMDTLIKKGAKIDALDKENATPLYLVSGNYFKCNIYEILSECAPYAISKSKDGTHKKINSLLPVDDTEISGEGQDNKTEVIKFLLDNGADVNTKCLENRTPLHLAALYDNAEVIDMLVKNKAKINVADSSGYTPLHLAVQGNHKKAVKILIENGANIDAKHKNCLTPLLFAIKFNYEEIVKVLLAKGADVNDESILLAIGCGFKNIAESILKNKKIDIDRAVADKSLLHLAAERGFKNIVEALIQKGADVNALTEHHTTPLYLAAQEGHKEVIEILLENKANATVRSDEGRSPLHVAAARGHNHVIEVLLNNGVNVEVKDYENRTALQLAISYGHFQVVNTLLEYKSIKVNAKGNEDWTVLHIASQAGNLETVKLLIDRGANINIRNTRGAKPMHVAAREGHKNILQFFLNNGCPIDDRGANDSTLLHYAAIGGQLDIASYLIEQNVDVNVTDGNGARPLHFAAHRGHEKVVTLLLSKGAIFNSVDKFQQTPFDLATGGNIQNILRSTEKLFKAVKHNMPLEVENLIKAGAFLDSKSIDNVMPLHYAAWKGYTKVVDILLKAQANPNAVGKGGCTPLHYAARYSHFGIVKALLSSGAIYNSCAINGKPPLNFSEHREIIDLLKFIEQSFDKIQNGDPKIIGILKQVKDIDIMKAVMNAHNGENKTLMVVAIRNNFSGIKELKQMLQGDVNTQIGVANLLFSQEKFQESLNIFQRILAKREKKFGPDNPATLEIQDHIAKVLYAQKKYQESLNVLKKIYEIQKKILGVDSKDALKTRSNIALILHRQGENKYALKLCQLVYKKQKYILGNSDPDTLETQIHMALVLHQLQKYEEALSINYKVFEKKKQALGENDLATLVVQNNIAMVLNDLGKHEEAVKTYRQVYEKRRKILGFAHSDCLRPLHNIATVLLKQEKYDEALKAFQEVLQLQRKYLGSNHLDTLDTEFNIANVLFQQGKWLHAYKAYKSGLECRKAILGPDHPSIIITLAKLEVIEFRLIFEGNDISEINRYIETDIFVAVSNGDTKCVRYLLDEGTDVNAKDADGGTPLHFAADLGHTDVMNVLLQNGADPTIASNKGNTPLHTAASKGNINIVKILLEHVKRENLSQVDHFVNFQTALSGSTALHIAVKNGCFAIVEYLLKHGAAYNIRDKHNKKTPFNYSANQNITDLLNLVDELFDYAKKGNDSIMEKLNKMNSDKLQTISNAHNKRGQTLVQVAVINKHKLIADLLIERLQNKST